MNAIDNLRSVLGIEHADPVSFSGPVASFPPRRVLRPSKLEFIANVSGRCTLDGRPARLVSGRLARIVSDRDSACFNWTVADLVLCKKGGAFETR